MTRDIDIEQRWIRTIARHRRLAAVHEAGHIVIARHSGVHVHRARIWPVDVDDLDSQWAWSGQVQTIGLDRAPAEVRCMIGVAGAVAEMSWHGEEIDTSDGWALGDALGLSSSDWSIADCDPGRRFDWPVLRAIEKTADLLRRGGPLWAALIAASNSLIQPWRENSDPTPLFTPPAHCPGGQLHSGHCDHVRGADPAVPRYLESSPGSVL